MPSLLSSSAGPRAVALSLVGEGRAGRRGLTNVSREVVGKAKEGRTGVVVVLEGVVVVGVEAEGVESFRVGVVGGLGRSHKRNSRRAVARLHQTRRYGSVYHRDTHTRTTRGEEHALDPLLLGQIRLCANDVNDDVRRDVLLQLCEPALQVVEGLSVRHVVCSGASRIEKNGRRTELDFQSDAEITRSKKGTGSDAHTRIATWAPR